MTEINLRSTILNGVWIQETYSGALDSSKGGAMSLTRQYILRKKGDSQFNKTQEMHQTEAYAALQSFILRFQYGIEYQTNEGKILLWTSKIRVNVDKDTYPVYKGEVMWEYDSRRPNYIYQPTTWSHRMVGGTQKMSVPIMPQRHYARPGEPFRIYTGVNWDEDNGVYEGVDCYAPEWHMVAKQQLPARLIDTDYLRMLMWMSKTVNLFPFRVDSQKNDAGFPPGTVLYLGAEMDEVFTKDDDGNDRHVDITHQFVVEPNMTDFYYDGIYIPLKEGHEYMWITSYNTEMGPRTAQVNIAPMYAKTDLNLLGLQ